jgi:COP9 signalosome complex subunit 2
LKVYWSHVFWISKFIFLWIDKLKRIIISFFFHSTIQGRIDQVNQVLELEKEDSRHGARDIAIEKWSNQINSVQLAILNKMS